MRRGFPLLLVFLSAASSFPPVPPLPATGWPSAATAEPFARQLLATEPAETLAHVLATDADAAPAILRNLGTAIITNDAALRTAISRYASAVVQQSVASMPPNSPDELQRIAALVVVDPRRYVADSAFRDRINAMMPRTIALLPQNVARAVLDALTIAAPLDFDTGEAAAAAAHLLPRTSAARRIPFDRTTLRFPDDLAGPIEASIFSLNTTAITPPDAVAFLQSVHSAAPSRRLLVLTDAAMRAALLPQREPLHLDLLEDRERPFTPWPRDPFTVARTRGGGVVLVNRPLPQPHREEDQNMVRAIVDAAPSSLDLRWSTRWTVAPTPFHNGQILRTPDAAWITIHSVEQRALALLGANSVPVETFSGRAGVERYVAATQRAAAELAAFLGTPVHFVHGLPHGENASGAMSSLAGGAGIDLDSVVTMLPRADGTIDALVGDLTAGATLVRNMSAAQWSPAREAYGFRDDSSTIGRSIADAQSAPAAAALQLFLDEVARSLRGRGIKVRRLPLLDVPATMLSRTDVPADSTFLITWNNVVLEQRGDTRQAEGFGSLLPAGDAAAAAAFKTSGYALTLFPPLITSVEFGGGYRCASNHVRP